MMDLSGNRNEINKRINKTHEELFPMLTKIGTLGMHKNAYNSTNGVCTV